MEKSLSISIFISLSLSLSLSFPRSLFALLIHSCWCDCLFASFTQLDKGNKEKSFSHFFSSFLLSFPSSSTSYGKQNKRKRCLSALLNYTLLCPFFIPFSLSPLLLSLSLCEGVTLNNILIYITLCLSFFLHFLLFFLRNCWHCH